MKNLLFLLISVFILSSCSLFNKPTSVVVDVPTIPVYIPTDVSTEKVYLHIVKDQEGNTLYSFDETNFLKLKKFILDVTKNNNFTREALCYYNEDICKVEETKK